MNAQDLTMLYRKHQEVLNQMRTLEENLRRQIQLVSENINALKREAYKQNVELD